MMNAQILSGLRNGQNTDLSAGTIRNADAVLLLLHSAGGMGRSDDLKAALRAWGGDLSYSYLFQSHSPSGGYGFVGTSFEQASNRVYHYPSAYGDEHYSVRRTYYYRVARGNYAVSSEGYKRLNELGFTNEKVIA
jgi:hypothetical protein